MLKYVVKGISAAKDKFPEDGPGAEHSELLKYLEAVHTVKHSQDEQQVARLVEQYDLVREHIPTGLHNSTEVSI